MEIIYVRQPDFYQRTAEDQYIIDQLVERRLTQLGRCDDYRNQQRIKAWAKAFNDVFRDYQHMMPMFHALWDRGIELHYPPIRLCVSN